jgi:hypothetical protein
MLDFSKFDQQKTAIVPISNSQFQYNRKKYSTSQCEDGWYEVTLKGNGAFIDRQFFGTLENVSSILGYVYNGNLIFQNFDVGKRKLGKDIQCGLLFNTAETFSSVRCILWEDGNVYYYEPNYSDTQIYEVKAAYDEEKNIESLKGITPELKTLCLFHDIERQQLRAVQEALKKKQEKEEYLKTIPGRLSSSFKNVGATLLNYSKQKYRGQDCFIVRWQLESSGRQFESVINSETFKTIEAGFCMSGDDERHNISSMVLTAKNYEDEGLIYITRR